ncbi:MAG: YggS family pyridoxal phosphate-dependent enzyme [Alphaproteobacteria bacterium]|nr:YggS family pyridoxal phosphate-dependent enzyme [Alphaproteobacteria bacterium]
MTMTVEKNLNTVREKIDNAARQWGRTGDDVQLIAVTKHKSDEDIQELLDVGHRLFGENRVQEAYEHWQARKDSGLYPDLQLHLIGPLQSNKVKDAVGLFDVIETVDREKLARKLSTVMQDAGIYLPYFIQVNTGEEEQKAGIAPRELSDFLGFCRNECVLNIVGLMCIPPVDDSHALHFALLHKLAKEHGLKQLSMGMSADYEKAIAHGATYVRIGSGLFGV